MSCFKAKAWLPFKLAQRTLKGTFKMCNDHLPGNDQVDLLYEIGQCEKHGVILLLAVPYFLLANQGTVIG